MDNIVQKMTERGMKVAGMCNMIDPLSWRVNVHVNTY